MEQKLDTVRKDNKTVSHTLIRLKNICFVGRAAGNYFICFAAVYVKEDIIDQLLVHFVSTSQSSPIFLASLGIYKLPF